MKIQVFEIKKSHEQYGHILGDERLNSRSNTRKKYKKLTRKTSFVDENRHRWDRGGPEAGRDTFFKVSNSKINKISKNQALLLISIMYNIIKFYNLCVLHHNFLNLNRKKYNIIKINTTAIKKFSIFSHKFIKDFTGVFAFFWP